MHRWKKRLLATAALWLCVGALLAQPFLVGVEWDSGKLYMIHPGTAELTEIGNTGIRNIGSLEFAPDGFLYGFTVTEEAALYKIDLNDPNNPTRVGALNVGYVFEGGLAFAANGTAHGVNVRDAERSHAMTVNLTTGRATRGRQLGVFPHDFNGLAFRADGVLTGIDREENALYTIDPATGGLVLSRRYNSGAGEPLIGAVGGMAVLEGQAYFSTSGKAGSFPGSNTLYTVNLQNGDFARVGAVNLWDATIRGIGISGLAAVPEPSTLLLLATGLAITLKRRKR